MTCRFSSKVKITFFQSVDDQKTVSTSTNLIRQDKFWAEFSTLEGAARMPAFCLVVE